MLLDRFGVMKAVLLNSMYLKLFGCLAQGYTEATQCNDVWCKVERRRRRNVQKFNEQRVVCYWQRGIDKIRIRQREEIEEHGKAQEYIKKRQKILE